MIKAPSSPKRLLFVTYGGGHAHMIYPVVQALRQSQACADGLLDVLVLALPAATGMLQSRGVKTLGFKDFLDPLQDVDALAWGEQLARKHHSTTSGADYGDSVAYLGLCYQDLVIRYGEATASDLMAKRGRQAFFPLTVMARIFDNLKPDFVVTTNSPRSEAAALAVANQRGLGSLAMTDLFTGLGDYLIAAQNITFLNETARDMFVADGLVDAAISNFFCTGNPAFDRIKVPTQDVDEAWMARHFPLVGNRKTVLHADMPAWWDANFKCSHFKTETETLAELEACYNAAIANGCAYLVRPHPSQDRALYEDWLVDRTDAFLAADCDLHELLANTDLLLARTTTVALEAALLHRRVLQLESTMHTDLPLAAMGVAWGSRCMADLHQEIGHALGDEAGFAKVLAQIIRVLPTEPAALKIAEIILNKLHLSCGLHIGAMNERPRQV